MLENVKIMLLQKKENRLTYQKLKKETQDALSQLLEQITELTGKKCYNEMMYSTIEWSLKKDISKCKCLQDLEKVKNYIDEAIEVQKWKLEKLANIHRNEIKKQSMFTVVDYNL